MAAAPPAGSGPPAAPSIITQPVFFLVVFVILPLAVIVGCFGAAVRYDVFPYGAGLDWRSAIPESLPTEWAWDADRYVSKAIDIAIGALVSTVVIVLPLLALGWIVVGVFALAEEARAGPPVSAAPQGQRVPSTWDPPARQGRRPATRVRPQPRQHFEAEREGLNAWLEKHQPMMMAFGLLSPFILLLLERL